MYDFQKQTKMIMFMWT